MEGIEEQEQEQEQGEGEEDNVRHGTTICQTYKTDSRHRRPQTSHQVTLRTSPKTRHAQRHRQNRACRTAASGHAIERIERLLQLQQTLSPYIYTTAADRHQPPSERDYNFMTTGAVCCSPSPSCDRRPAVERRNCEPSQRWSNAWRFAFTEHRWPNAEDDDIRDQRTYVLMTINAPRRRYTSNIA